MNTQRRRFDWFSDPISRLRAGHAFVAATCLCLAACALTNGGTVEGEFCDSEYTNQTTLYFGSGTADGSSVTPTQWEGFVEEELVRRFGEGFTVLSGKGYWRDQISGQTLREGTWIFVRINQLSEAEESNLSQVIAEYKSRFSQQSVLRVDTTVCGRFL